MKQAVLNLNAFGQQSHRAVAEFNEAIRQGILAPTAQKEHIVAGMIGSRFRRGEPLESSQHELVFRRVTKPAVFKANSLRLICKGGTSKELEAADLHMLRPLDHQTVIPNAGDN